MIEQTILDYIPLPSCVIDKDGKVSAANEKIGEVFTYAGIEGRDMYALFGIKHGKLIAAAIAGTSIELRRNKTQYLLKLKSLGENYDKNDNDPDILVTFVDITRLKELEKKNENARIVMAAVHVDNFQELSETTADESNLNVLSLIDKVIRKWAGVLEASITRYKDDLYFLVMNNLNYRKFKDGNFQILEEVRTIKAADDFPVTVSIGIGLNAGSLVDIDQNSADALDLALGRGGDQVVVKDGEIINYYGGKIQTFEKSDRGKSRVISHALKQLMLQADKIIIMGHKYPDMDSFGSAVGIHRMAAIYGKEAFIIINEYNETLSEIYKAAKEQDDYKFISSERAMEIVDENTLVVVVDTNRPVLIDCPELLEKTDKVALIDHHRMTSDSLKELTLSFVESYASSASELVSEILIFTGEKKPVTKFEAEALLAGITVDTNRFSVKTGVRTFDAASWLKQQGANTAEVKKYFQSEMEMFKVKAKGVADAEFIGESIALSVCHGNNADAQIVNSQVADELLTIKGIKASFVSGRNERGRTVISARSLGEINVQLIMEKFGGGGHLTTAGAQVDISPEEVMDELKIILSEIQE